MKIVQINTFPYKATGAIMLNIHRALLENGEDSYVVWGRGRDAQNDREIVIKDDLGTKLHGAYTRLTDKTGFASSRATRRLLNRLDEIAPDLIHLHNIHGYYINIQMLFDYIRAHNIRVIWTLHDCWPFTGHCAYFDAVGCEKWKTGCHSCPQKRTYPASLGLDRSKWNWEKKKQLFSGLDITIVTPSRWLADIVKESFLGGYPTKVIPNGIDAEIFRPRCGVFREKSGIKQKIILGVAAEWTERKGLRDFLRLNELIDHGEYRIVLVGLTKEQKSKLPLDMLGLERTSNPVELAEIYSDAYVFFNPTYEDNYPTTNLEALCCGTPVVTYNTGGSPESAQGGGIVVEKGNVEAVAEMLGSGIVAQPNQEDVREWASGATMVEKYVTFYKNLMIDNSKNEDR